MSLDRRDERLAPSPPWVVFAGAALFVNIPMYTCVEKTSVS